MALSSQRAEIHHPSGSGKRGSYTANLLGNISTHLAGLQGYDVMALELVQNADDAGADEVVFDITDDGLEVRNSGVFTFCGDLHSKPCALKATSGYACDYHRIVDVGSGGKLLRSENIGRFGIGFVATYQVTDHPEIRSAGIKLTLVPESGEWIEEPSQETGGTTFLLPWARNPDSETRLALGVSHIGASHIDQIAADIARVLRRSLLFLRHVRLAEVRREGNLLLGCELERSDASDLMVSFRPTGQTERWHILRADAAETARGLYERHPRLVSFGRSTEVSIGLRIEPKSLRDGLLYAFLPTEQQTGLPLHINADFFPESDRKHVIFGGHQHEQAWNEMLVEAAAAEIARDPEGLVNLLGHARLWEILDKAYELATTNTDVPACYERIWERLQTTAPRARIVPTQDGSVHRPDEVYLPPSRLSGDQARALLEVGGLVASEELRPFRNAMNQLGGDVLTLDRLVGILERGISPGAGTARVDDARIAEFYRPIWRLVEELLPEFGRPGSGAVERFKRLPLMVTEDRVPIEIGRSYMAPAGVDPERVAALLPGLAVVSRRFSGYPKLGQFVRTLDLGAVATHIRSRVDSSSPDEVVGTDVGRLGGFYTLLADLDERGTAGAPVYQSLRGLPIWRSSHGFVSATRAMLPGDFTDPIGRADLLDTSVLSASAREFVSKKLGVNTQTIQAYVQNVLPDFFGEAGPQEPVKYERLMAELADHPSLANDEATRKLLGSLPLVPTQNGGWSRPADTYRRSEGLVKVLGDAKHLWLDERRVPDAPSVHAFLDLVGILRSATARHLVERILSIAEEGPPSDAARSASAEAFYALCDNYEAWREDEAFQDAVADLMHTDCLPDDGDLEEWYSPRSLYAPFRAEAFRSQASVLGFRTTGRLKTELLECLGVTINPPTGLVIEHLKHCMEHGIGPHQTTYQVLNERAQASDPLVSELEGTRCIYDGGGFVRTNQVYWVAQPLGKYAFTVPESIESFTPLFRAIGVKDAPDCADYVDILLDLTVAHFESSTPVEGTERTVYDTCLAAVAEAHAREECGAADLRRLAEAPTVLNLAGMARPPDELLLHDSEWYAGFFGDDLDEALCRVGPELWPLAEALGVRRLSESATVSLDYVGPPEREERGIADKFAERTDIIARLLHEEPVEIRDRFREALSEIRAVSADDIRIEASIVLTGDEFCAPPTAAQAFYDMETGRLTVRRPVDGRRWSHVLNAVFHQLMPGATGGKISKLVLGVRPLMEMAVQVAHRELNDAGVPPLDAVAGTADAEEVASQELGELGADEAETYYRDSDGTGVHGREAEPPTVVRDGSADEKEGQEFKGAEADGHTRGGPANGDSDAARPKEKARPKHKDRLDHRLLSYVERELAESAEDGIQAGNRSEHNLAVEAVARAAVCAYEEVRGRFPEQMAQTHPGYDIVSHDPLAGENRWIEVKGVAGEWNRTGVGLSRVQFSNAQNYGDSYWLYVVEFAFDKEAARVHAIRNPAGQVTAFMFDGNWRETAVDERADPTMRFVPGVRVRHENLGTGEVLGVVTKGATKLLTVRFDRTGQDVPNVPLNLRQIHVLEDGDGDDGS